MEITEGEMALVFYVYGTFRRTPWSQGHGDDDFVFGVVWWWDFREPWAVRMRAVQGPHLKVFFLCCEKIFVARNLSGQAPSSVPTDDFLVKPLVSLVPDK